MIVGALLVLGVVVVALSVLGLWVAEGPFNKLHFVTPVCSLGVAAFTLAVMVQEGPHLSAFKALVVGLLLALGNPAFQHATGRAARIRALGELDLDRAEQQP